jgi:hypothetical protein
VERVTATIQIDVLWDCTNTDVMEDPFVYFFILSGGFSSPANRPNL